MKTSRSMTAIAALALVTLTACGPGGTASPTETTTVTAIPSPSGSVTPSPSVTPVVTSTPTPTLVGGCPEFTEEMSAIDYNRFGGICIGMSFAQAEAVSEIPVSGEASCPWLATVVSDEGLGYYVSALSPYETPGSEIWYFRMMWQGDPATALAYDLPATPEGITIGSTEADFNAAYPSAVTKLVDDISRGPRDERLVTEPDGNTFVFDIMDGRVSEITWGQKLANGQNGELCAL
jgi:hypothetical protein